MLSTEDNENLQLLKINEASKLINESLQKLDDAKSLFDIPNTSVSILSTSLSELVSKRNKLILASNEIKEFDPNESAFIAKIQDAIYEINTFLELTNSSVHLESTNDYLTAKSLVSRRSSRSSKTYCSAEAVFRLKAKLQLAERDIQLRKRAADLKARSEKARLEIEAESMKIQILSDSINEDNDLLGEDLENIMTAFVTNENQKRVVTKPERSMDAGENECCANLKIENENLQKLIKSILDAKQPDFVQTKPSYDPAMIMTKIQVLNSLVPFKFAGEFEKFPIFRKHVRAHLEDGILPESEKCIFLSRFLEGEALRVFHSNVGLTYDESIKLLERRFGNNAAITEAWVKRLTEGSNTSKSDPKGILDFAEDISTATRVLPQDAILELSGKLCLKKIVARLPREYVPDWVKLCESKLNKETIYDLASYVSTLANQLNHPVYRSRTWTSDEDYSVKSKTKGFLGLTTKREASHSEDQLLKRLEIETTINEPKRYEKSSPIDACVYCKGLHRVQECTELAEENSELIRKFVQSKGLCYSCLEPFHLSKYCRKRAECNVRGCHMKHPTSLHNYRTSFTEENVAVSKITSTQDSNTYSFIIPVYVNHKDDPDNKVLTYAFLDDGSDSCYISQDLTKKLGVRGQKTKLYLTTLQSQSTESTFKVQGLQVSNFDRSNCISLPMNTYTRKSIPISHDVIPTRDSVDYFKHLRPIKHELQPLYRGLKVHLIIGNNCPAALCPTRSVRGNAQEPYALKTDLGWGIVGPKLTIADNELAPTYY